MEGIRLEDRLFILNRALYLIDNYFAHWEAVPDLDVGKLFYKHVDAVRRAKDRYAFGLVMSEIIADLKNGHTHYKDWWLQKTYGMPLGFYAFYHDREKKWVVVQSEDKRIGIGEMVLRINGQTTEAFFQRQKGYISGSSERAQRNALFNHAYLFPERMAVETESGTIIVERTKMGKAKRHSSRTTGKLLDKNFAYIRILSFAKPLYEKQALKFVSKFAKCKTIIVDVRNNYGGGTPLKLLGKLMTRPWKRSIAAYVQPLAGLEVSRGFKAKELSHGHMFKYDERKRIKPGRNHYRGKVIVLTNEQTNSAAEDFALTLAENRRAKIVGARTRGSNGNGELYQLKGDIWMQLGIYRIYFKDGSAFEGVGIKPDVEAYLTIKDIRQGRDAVLERAVKLAKS